MVVPEPVDDGRVIVVSAAARALRRSLRPIEWVVLEDVALDARRNDAGVLVASTSARQVAEHLGLTPGAVARALARLRSTGLVSHARQAGPVGRFGLSAYVLGPVSGLAVVAADQAPGVVPPRAAPPHIDAPRVAERHMGADRPGVDSSGSTGPGPDRRPARNRVVAVRDTALGDPVAGRPTLTDTAARPRVMSRRPAPAVDQLSLLDDAHHDPSQNRQP